MKTRIHPRSTICNPISSAFLCDLCGLAVNLSEIIGAASPRRPTGDGLGQDVPATVKKRARCPRSRIESRFISDFWTFDSSFSAFQHFSVSAFILRFYPTGWDKYWYRQKISEKKFRSLPIQHFRVPLKHAAPLPSSHFGFSAQARKHLLRVAFPLLGHFQSINET
jgi:hypothetical protein